jgi:predicted small lipoprotein YifL
MRQLTTRSIVFAAGFILAACGGAEPLLELPPGAEQGDLGP